MTFSSASLAVSLGYPEIGAELAPNNPPVDFGSPNPKGLVSSFLPAFIIIGFNYSVLDSSFLSPNKLTGFPSVAFGGRENPYFPNPLNPWVF